MIIYFRKVDIASFIIVCNKIYFSANNIGVMGFVPDME